MGKYFKYPAKERRRRTKTTGCLMRPKSECTASPRPAILEFWKCFGLNADGLQLPVRPTGERSTGVPEPSAKQRLKWGVMRRLEPVAYCTAHSKNIIHCENRCKESSTGSPIFKSCLKGPINNLTLLDGTAPKYIKSYLPRLFNNSNNERFALEVTTFYKFHHQT